jgi:hypothetical protein
MIVADWFEFREATTAGGRAERPLPIGVEGILNSYRTGWVA